MGSMYKLLMLITVFFLQLFFIEVSVAEDYNILAFGAVNDGKTINTKAIQRAVDQANKSKGGRVIFPGGKYLSGSFILKSGVELVLNRGAILLGSIDPRNYEKMEFEGALVSQKADDNSKLALIIAYKADDIGISGEGVIDGQGRELALFADSLHQIGVRIDPKYGSRLSEPYRPKIINFMECRNVNVNGITIKNSSCWVQTYELCSNVTLDHLTVISRAYWNNDGIDISDSKNVRITNCDINSADDGICLKSYHEGHFSDSIYIADCTIRASASAVKFGTASIGGFKNVVIDNLRVYDTYRSAIAIESVDGGFIENVSVSNITAKNTGNALFVRLGHRAGENAGTVKNISFKNIKVQVPFGRPDIDYDMRGPDLGFAHNQLPASITGIRGHCIENVSLENIEISYPGRASKGIAYIPVWQLSKVPEREKSYPEYSMFGELPAWALYVRHVKGIKMKNIMLKLDDTDFRPALVLDDVEKVKIEKMDFPAVNNEQIMLKEVRDYELDKDLLEYVKNM